MRGEQVIVQVIVHDGAVTIFSFDLVFKNESLLRNEVSVIKKTWFVLWFAFFFTPR